MSMFDLAGREVNIFFENGDDENGEILSWRDDCLWIRDKVGSTVWVNLSKVIFIDVLEVKDNADKTMA